MKKILILLFLIFFYNCCNKTKLLNNGLTVKANKITDFSIYIEKDSLNNSNSDTLSISERYYNNNDQIIHRLNLDLIDGDTIEIEYIYNSFNKIEKELVNISSDSISFLVNYFYKDSLPYKSKANAVTKTFRFNAIADYYYDSKLRLIKTATKSSYVDLESNDTITNSLQIDKYNLDKNITESVITNYLKPQRNERIVFDYDCHLLSEQKKFNYNDSLISTTKYKYDLDKFENWIKRASYIDGEIEFIVTRKIEYN